MKIESSWKALLPWLMIATLMVALPLSILKAGDHFLEIDQYERTDDPGIWMGYTTTAYSMKDIYGLKLINRKEGIARISMEKVLALQKSEFSRDSKMLKSF